MAVGWDYINAIRKSGREPDPEDLPPALEWEAEVWGLYERIQTQWRAAGMGRLIGLDYNPAIAIIKANGWPLQRALTLLQGVEAGFLEVWAENSGG